VMVKRLRALGAEVEVVSDNPDFAPRLCPAEDVEVIGRVVWLSRALL
jgi:repressor LexA